MKGRLCGLHERPCVSPLFVTLLLSAYQSSLFFVLCLVLDYISSCALLINFFDQL